MSSVCVPVHLFHVIRVHLTCGVQAFSAPCLCVRERHKSADRQAPVSGLEWSTLFARRVLLTSRRVASRLVVVTIVFVREGLEHSALHCIAKPFSYASPLAECALFVHCCGFASGVLCCRSLCSHSLTTILATMNELLSTSVKTLLEELRRAARLLCTQCSG